MATIKSLVHFKGIVRDISVTPEAVERLGKEFFIDVVDNNKPNGFMVLKETRLDNSVVYMSPSEIVALSEKGPNLNQILEVHERLTHTEVYGTVVLLKSLGYTKKGANWKPPVGKNPFEEIGKIQAILDRELCGFTSSFDSASLAGMIYSSIK